MTMTPTEQRAPMTDLIARLEWATGPDRELDAEIENTWWLIVWGKKAPKEHVKNAPRYTASIDAALTLAPDGAWWWVERQPLIDNKYLAGCGDERIASASTPALALCIAALRAQEKDTNA